MVGETLLGLPNHGKEEKQKEEPGGSRQCPHETAAISHLAYLLRVAGGKEKAWYLKAAVCVLMGQLLSSALSLWPESSPAARAGCDSGAPRQVPVGVPVKLSSVLLALGAPQRERLVQSSLSRAPGAPPRT
ncbi:hypothetical protein NDU88_007950 [Pleurodeles waltl]|uniref:Uncharacterized protein n=1 Tax=Pleurodeles waltl TaxID=8319 RepID=A0AAV7RUN7_PLEWA|nr:hypothetical protein NDU88_007950 [Pleurodeles waltl]